MDKNEKALSSVKVAPYQSVNGIVFGSVKSSVLASHGQPLQITKSQIGLTELEYGDITLRFSQERLELVEVTANSPLLLIDDFSVKFDALRAFLKANDPDAFEAAGFHVSPKFGIAFDLHYPNFVTAFSQGELAGWRSLSANPG